MNEMIVMISLLFIILNGIDIIQTRTILKLEIESNPIIRFLGFKKFIFYKIFIVIFIIYNFKDNINLLIIVTVFYIWVTYHNYNILKDCSS